MVQVRRIFSKNLNTPIVQPSRCPELLSGRYPEHIHLIALTNLIKGTFAVQNFLRDSFIRNGFNDFCCTELCYREKFHLVDRGVSSCVECFF